LALNALAFAKVMLVAHDLHSADRFHDTPLIYPTPLKSFVYTVVLACFKIAEGFVIGRMHGSSFRRVPLILRRHVEGNSDPGGFGVRYADSVLRCHRTSACVGRRPLVEADHEYDHVSLHLARDFKLADPSAYARRPEKCDRKPETVVVSLG
jgi:hypothetical protein